MLCTTTVFDVEFLLAFTAIEQTIEDVFEVCGIVFGRNVDNNAK